MINHTGVNQTMYLTNIFATIILIVFPTVIEGLPKTLAWSGGPLHQECEQHSTFLMHTGKHVRENVVVVKAVSFKENIYVMSPRWKRGVLGTVWVILRGRTGVELDPFPSETVHTEGDCSAIQNAVDLYIDHLGNIWVLDTGIVETLDRPRCTCAPKVTVINIPKRKITKSFELTAVTPSSLLQNIVVENGLTKAFVYVSDAARGAIIVHDTANNAQWSVLVCAPAVGLQMVPIKRGLGHSTLFINRLQSKDLLELFTDALKKNSPSTVRVYSEQSQPVVLLGSDSHQIYFRHSECCDVLAWDTRDPLNSSYVQNVHSPGPRLTPTSVSTDPLKHAILVLDSNYAETMNSNSATYHRITYVDMW